MLWETQLEASLCLCVCLLCRVINSHQDIAQQDAAFIPFNWHNSDRTGS